ncbi:MAG: NUDIX hydrolase [Patescibacteria group bacterium]|jgi:8-oxo-dGTP diphosphatase
MNRPQVKVACGALIVRGKTFVAVQQAKEYIKGKWDIPIGKLEYNEDILNCVRREVKEETGLRIKLTGVLGLYQQKSAIGNNIVKIIFTATTKSTKFIYPQHEIMNVQWISFSECLSLPKAQLRSPDMKHMVQDYRKRGDFDLSIVHSLGFTKRT